MQRKIIDFSSKTIPVNPREFSDYINQFHIELSYLQNCADKEHQEAFKIIDHAHYCGSRISPKQCRELHEKWKLVEQLEIILNATLFRHKNPTSQDLIDAIMLYEQLEKSHRDFFTQHRRIAPD